MRRAVTFRWLAEPDSRITTRVDAADRPAGRQLSGSHRMHACSLASPSYAGIDWTGHDDACMYVTQEGHRETGGDVHHIINHACMHATSALAT